MLLLLYLLLHYYCHYHYHNCYYYFYYDYVYDYYYYEHHHYQASTRWVIAHFSFLLVQFFSYSCSSPRFPCKRCDWDFETCSSAVAGGHLHVLQWARENGCDWQHYSIKFGLQASMYVHVWFIFSSFALHNFDFLCMSPLYLVIDEGV